MNPKRIIAAIMGGAARRPLAVGVAVGLLAIAGGALALRLEPSAATDTLVGRNTDSFKASERFHKQFGDDAVFVLVREPLSKLVLTADIERVLGLEGCISGNLPAGETPRGGADGPCAKLAESKPAKVVFGPGTFLNTAVGQISDQLDAESKAKAAQAERAAKAARGLARARGYSQSEAKRAGEQAKQLVYAEFTRNILQIALKYGLGINALPRLNNPAFIAKIVFDSGKPAGTPKDRFAYLFPNRNSALIQVRLRPDLSEAEHNRAIALIRQAVAMPDWQLPNGKGTYVVTGAPVVVADLTRSISDSILLLLIAALVVMALVLALVFRARLRLLPLVVALAAAGLTFGGLSLVGASLTMASIGVLPVLIGLSVDYAIQLQSRIQEREEADPQPIRDAVERTAGTGAPTVATAAAATAAGFAVLLLSPVPMVQAFGVLLVAGIGLALFCALSLGTAALVALAPGARAGSRVPRPLRRLGSALAPAGRGAEELVRENRASRALAARGVAARSAALRAAAQKPGRVLAIGLAAAVVGWGLDTQTSVESDIQKLVPQDLPALRDVRALQESTDIGGEIDVVVSSDKLTEPAVVRWMTDYQAALLKRFGYSSKRGCGEAELCPAFSLPDLFQSGGQASQAELTELLDAVPPYFSQGVITGDRRTATLAFGIRLMPLERQQRVIEGMRAALHPPPGVRAELAGLPVLAAEANDRVASQWRRLLTLVAGLLAVALVLLVALRSRRRALVPLIPIALATGWSALVLFAVRIPLNPMSVTLGALVIAISTEFSVLLSERYRQEREAGHGPNEALARTYRSTGAAVTASGVTAIAGFAVLILSDIRMLRDFGFVTVIDLTVSLLGVLIVLPSVLMLAERGELVPARALSRLRGVRLRPRRAGA